MELPNPNQLSKKQLAEFAQKIQQWFLLDTKEKVEFINPNKEVGGGDTVERMVSLLDEFGLLEPIGGTECHTCGAVVDEKLMHPVGSCPGEIIWFCSECFDERLHTVQ